eukprot:CAMPEP_0119043572 /NCGR_PEP_ID=MMETSP1177-20130426/23448_1 /TAXON_ID=2985 /ORGANISM="Ochromonas sp, Strain CCMP1899" /LENGTH=664 /DNA_ID=CAMNT_0007011939 /DNA_START=233 /DNA_END=2227 /DNA_ORIENTATION=+
MPSYQEQQEIASRVQKYVQMREIQKLKERGASSEDVANAVRNGTFVGKAGSIMNKKGYQKFLGKGSLDQRLRAVVQYKRSAIATSTENGEQEMTPTEQRELDQMMDSDDDDDDDEGLPGDDEEELYESMVLKIIEDNKLNDLKEKFLLDKDAQKSAIIDDKEIESSANNTIVGNGTNNGEDPDLYTPKVSTWGLFPRAKDISKTYGGGRVITREEMNRMDEEYKDKYESGKKAEKLYVNEVAKLEDENTEKIKDAIVRSRNLMGMGSRQAAVTVLEKVKPFLTSHSQLGGESFLELAMALETVDRTDEAREIYSKLISVSWSDKTKRNALQLMQGLDITLKIKKSGMDRSFKPMSDREAAAQNLAMEKIAEALKPGLTNAWNDYKKGDPQPWYDDGGKTMAATKIESFKDAYYLLEKAFNPLSKIPSQLIQRSLRKMYLSSDVEKLGLLKELGVLDKKEKKRVTTVSDPSSDPFYIPGLNRDADPFAAKPVILESDKIMMDTKPIIQKKKQPEITSILKSSRNPIVMESFEKSVNGTWDLVASLVDKAPYAASRFEPGAIRRSLDLPNSMCSESYPVLWGLSTAKINTLLEFDNLRSEVSISGDQLPGSKAPWQKQKEKVNKRGFQVLYTDDGMLVTREVSENAGTSDLYSLWKKVKPQIWIKY